MAYGCCSLVAHSFEEVPNPGPDLHEPSDQPELPERLEQVAVLAQVIIDAKNDYCQEYPPEKDGFDQLQHRVGRRLHRCGRRSKLGDLGRLNGGIRLRPQQAEQPDDPHKKKLQDGNKKLNDGGSYLQETVQKRSKNFQQG